MNSVKGKHGHYRFTWQSDRLHAEVKAFSMKIAFENSAPLWSPQTFPVGFKGISGLEQTYLLIYLVNEICYNVQYAKT